MKLPIYGLPRHASACEGGATATSAFDLARNAREDIYTCLKSWPSISTKDTPLFCGLPVSTNFLGGYGTFEKGFGLIHSVH